MLLPVGCRKVIGFRISLFDPFYTKYSSTSVFVYFFFQNYSRDKRLKDMLDVWQICGDWFGYPTGWIYRRIWQRSINKCVAEKKILLFISNPLSTLLVCT